MEEEMWMDGRQEDGELLSQWKTLGVVQIEDQMLRSVASHPRFQFHSTSLRLTPRHVLFNLLCSDVALSQLLYCSLDLWSSSSIP